MQNNTNYTQPTPSSSQDGRIAMSIDQEERLENDGGGGSRAVTIWSFIIQIVSQLLSIKIIKN